MGLIADSCLRLIDMETKVIAWGRRGRFEITRRKFFWRWTYSIEPWAGLYYFFHGCCLPLLVDRVVGEYRSHRARAKYGNETRWKACGTKQLICGRP